MLCTYCAGTSGRIAVLRLLTLQNSGETGQNIAQFFQTKVALFSTWITVNSGLRITVPVHIIYMYTHDCSEIHTHPNLNVVLDRVHNLRDIVVYMCIDVQSAFTQMIRELTLGLEAPHSVPRQRTASTVMTSLAWQEEQPSGTSLRPFPPLQALATSSGPWPSPVSRISQQHRCSLPPCNQPSRAAVPLGDFCRLVAEVVPQSDGFQSGQQALGCLGTSSH